MKSRELKKNIKRSQGERRTREQALKEESKPPKRRRYKILEEDWGFQVGATRSLPKVGEEELPLGALIKSHQPTMDGWVIRRGCEEKPPLLADILKTETGDPEIGGGPRVFEGGEEESQGASSVVGRGAPPWTTRRDNNLTTTTLKQQDIRQIFMRTKAPSSCSEEKLETNSTSHKCDVKDEDNRSMKFCEYDWVLMKCKTHEGLLTRHRVSTTRWAFIASKNCFGNVRKSSTRWICSKKNMTTLSTSLQNDL